MSVQTSNGLQTVVAYVMTAPYCEKAQPPTSTYLRTVLTGYRMAGFDPDAVLRAAAKAREMQTQQVQRKRSGTER